MDDTELTEFEIIEVEAVKAVPAGANGFPHLIMKGLPDPVAKADGESWGPAHGAFTGTHSHAHAANDTQGDDETHEHSHSHDGDGDHGHAHSAGKSVPAWHSPAALLVRLAQENQDTPREALFKAVNADGQVDEQADIDGGQQAIALIAKLIGYEAAELAAGDLDEIRDIGLLCEAASTLKWWLRGEQAGQVAACGCAPDCSCCMGVVMASTDGPPDADELAKSDLSAKELNDLPDNAFAYIEPGGTKDSDGKTTPRKLRHFAIHDKTHADNAASRIAQGAKFGDKAKGNVEAAQKRFGESDTSKSAVAEPEGTMQTGGEGTGSLEKAVESAVAKATAPLVELQKELEGLVAKAKALPVPGGPVISTVRAGAQAQGNGYWLAKAAYYRAQAEQHSDRQTADGYRQLARDAEASAATGKPAPAGTPAPSPA
jgi:hypothetical protein